jgi:hypothetical protein
LALRMVLSTLKFSVQAGTSSEKFYVIRTVDVASYTQLLLRIIPDLCSLACMVHDQW